VQDIENRGWEGVLRGKSVFRKIASAFGQAGEFSAERASGYRATDP
jgi:hypothetical protein